MVIPLCKWTIMESFEGGQVPPPETDKNLLKIT